MAGIVSVFTFVDEASIYTFLDLAVTAANLVLWGGVRTPSHHRPFKLWFEFEVHLTSFSQRGRKLLVFLDELTETRAKVHFIHSFIHSFIFWRLILPPGQVRVCSQEMLWTDRV